MLNRVMCAADGKGRECGGSTLFDEIICLLTKLAEGTPTQCQVQAVLPIALLYLGGSLILRK
jgi:hypothetical protein